MEAIAELEKMYATIPAMECKGLCTSYCGPIGMGETERLRILERIGHPPFSKIFPTIHDLDDLAGRELLSRVAVGCLTCPMLKDGRCKVYDIRPMICRLWGASEDLRCPHGCRPKKLLTRAESKHLIRAASNL